jgi:hypothetical protein
MSAGPSTAALDLILSDEIAGKSWAGRWLGISLGVGSAWAGLELGVDRWANIVPDIRG